jgi:Tfp pilus assembly protein PilF
MDSQAVISNLENLLAQGKESALLRFSLGSEYLKLGATWVAVFHLKRALEIDPNYSAAWKVLGMAYAETGILHGALDVYRRGVEVASRRGDQQAAKEMTVFARRIEKKISP